MESVRDLLARGQGEERVLDGVGRRVGAAEGRGFVDANLEGADGRIAAQASNLPTVDAEGGKGRLGRCRFQRVRVADTSGAKVKSVMESMSSQDVRDVANGRSRGQWPGGHPSRVPEAMSGPHPRSRRGSADPARVTSNPSLSTTGPPTHTHLGRRSSRGGHGPTVLTRGLRHKAGAVTDGRSPGGLRSCRTGWWPPGDRTSALDGDPLRLDPSSARLAREVSATRPQPRLLAHASTCAEELSLSEPVIGASPARTRTPAR